MIFKKHPKNITKVFVLLDFDEVKDEEDKEDSDVEMDKERLEPRSDDDDT